MQPYPSSSWTRLDREPYLQDAATGPSSLRSNVHRPLLLAARRRTGARARRSAEGVSGARHRGHRWAFTGARTGHRRCDRHRWLPLRSIDGRPDHHGPRPWRAPGIQARPCWVATRDREGSEEGRSERVGGWRLGRQVAGGALVRVRDGRVERNALRHLLRSVPRSTRGGRGVRQAER